MRGAQCASEDFLRRGVRAERAPPVRSRRGVRALVFVRGASAGQKVRMLRLRCAVCARAREDEANGKKEGKGKGRGISVRRRRTAASFSVFPVSRQGDDFPLFLGLFVEGCDVTPVSFGCKTFRQWRRLGSIRAPDRRRNTYDDLSHVLSVAPSLGVCSP